MVVTEGRIMQARSERPTRAMQRGAFSVDSDEELLAPVMRELVERRLFSLVECGEFAAHQRGMVRCHSSALRQAGC